MGRNSIEPEDGILAIGLAGHAAACGEEAASIPTVCLLIDSRSHLNRCASVFQRENHAAGRAAATLLRDRGCRELVFLGRRDIPASRERLAGVEETARENGAFFRHISCRLNYDEGLRLGRELDLGRGTHPLGVVANNGWLALGLRRGLWERAAAPRREVRIASFDGLSIPTDPGRVKSMQHLSVTTGAARFPSL